MAGYSRTGKRDEADDAGDRGEQGDGDRQNGPANAELGQRHRCAHCAVGSPSSTVTADPWRSCGKPRGDDRLAGLEARQDLHAAVGADARDDFAALGLTVDDDEHERGLEVRDQRFGRHEQRVLGLAERELDVRERARQQHLAGIRAQRTNQQRARFRVDARIVGVHVAREPLRRGRPP